MADDVVIVGGGTAGCVLAARLTEDPSRQVLLLEAGPDYPSLDALPHELADGQFVTDSHDWGFVSELGALGRPLSLLRARVTGGCSATNAGFALRGLPRDYDRWAELGNDGWAFADVLPAFCAIENDADFGTEPWHGDAGPLPIRRYPPEEQSELARAFLAAAVDAGHPAVDDLNRPGAVGAAAAPVNVRDGVRISTALSFLAAARERPNLMVRADTLVDRVVVTKGRATGVRLAGGETINAGLVVLAAGAYASPAILLRSGVGAPDVLHELSIGVVAALGGVGRHLVEHPRVSLDVPVRVPEHDVPRFQSIVTWDGGGDSGADLYDIHLGTAGPFDDGSGGAVAGLSFSYLKPRSRGSVRLRSADPNALPVVDTGFLREEHDVDRLVGALREMRRLARTPPLSELILGAELAPAPDVDDDDTEGLAAAIRAACASYFHPVGTCRMGPDPDDAAVVDARGRVHGVDSLVVADASVMPEIPSAGTNLPTMMVAQRIAGFVAEG